MNYFIMLENLFIFKISSYVTLILIERQLKAIEFEMCQIGSEWDLLIFHLCRDRQWTDL